MDDQVRNHNEIHEITTWLSENKIDCVKYNYSLDDSVQNFTSYEATIELSKDFNELIITNRKPIANEVYVLEADPLTVEKIKFQEQIVALEEQLLKYQHKPVNLSKIKKDMKELCKDFELSDYKKYVLELKQSVDGFRTSHGEHEHGDQ